MEKFQTSDIPKSCPEFSYEWLEAELDTVATRTAKML